MGTDNMSILSNASTGPETKTVPELIRAEISVCDSDLDMIADFEGNKVDRKNHLIGKMNGLLVALDISER